MKCNLESFTLFITEIDQYFKFIAAFLYWITYYTLIDYNTDALSFIKKGIEKGRYNKALHVIIRGTFCNK